MEEIIDIEAIPRAPRYIYTVDYIFHNQFETASAFVKRNDETGFHIQEFYEICVISKGEGYHVIEDTVVKTSPFFAFTQFSFTMESFRLSI